METVSVLYATLGYMGLVVAILWGMLFVGDGARLLEVSSAARTPG